LNDLRKGIKLERLDRSTFQSFSSTFLFEDKLVHTVDHVFIYFLIFY